MVTRIGVVGGGTMGHGIAAAFALSNFNVSIFEPVEAQRARIFPAIREQYALLVEENMLTEAGVTAALERISLYDKLEDAVGHADFVVEATPERLELKQDLFETLDKICPEHTILASNTSSLPLEKMMAKVSPARRKRMLVTHWYNPPLFMPIVELSFFGNMDEEDFESVSALHQIIGKQTVKVLKDVPGLVANRIQQAVARETFSIIEQGIAEPEDVDKALKFGPAFRYATTGQLEVADFGGLDIWLTVGDNLLSVMDHSTKANDLLRKRVEEGKLGVKTGEGFFSYDPKTLAEKQKAFNKRLIHQLEASKAYV